MISSDQLHQLLPEVRRIAQQAGDIIMDVYENGFEIETKQDNSPVTTADMAAHHYIEAALKQLSPQFPILSEESAHLPFAERASRETYWLVDPLDGTKEFIKRRDSFTVNIALIDQHQSVLGVIDAPAMGISYYASQGLGSFKQEKAGEEVQIHTREMPALPVFAGSRSHIGKQLEAFLNNVKAVHGDYQLLSMGSSLKMCLVAEGVADLYPRLWLTSEWDTAAAHCIVNEAGGKLVQTDMSPLRYNTKDSLLNPYFFTIGNNTIDWSQYLPAEDL